MATPGSLVCSEEMMEESPDVTSELEARERYKNELSSKLIDRHRVITAFSDTKLTQDDRVLKRMLQMEKLCNYDLNYFCTVQDLVTPNMKRDVAIWMFEVCDEERMHTAVFLRAAQYMDKFLSLQRIFANQLQLLGAVCILVSSKMAGTLISSRRLVAYTADSITLDLLLEWEGLILGLLQWDMNGIVSADFVQHILNVLPKHLWDKDAIYERIKTFISYCAVDHVFAQYLPSTIASASIVAALAPFISSESHNQVLAKIQNAILIDLKQLKQCMDLITTTVQLTVEGRRKNMELENEAVGSAANSNGRSIKAR